MQATCVLLVVCLAASGFACSSGEPGTDDADIGCVPDCEGKECGDDGCDGSCGECGEGMVCNEDNICGTVGNPCLAACDGLECGDGGAAGCNCGICGVGFECDDDGSCACIPYCEGMECGGDRCGGSCGVCPGGCPVPMECDEWGLCTALCERVCYGKECGDDGCGCPCGECLDSEICHAGECCAPGCEGKECGPDGCGGSCGSCGAGWVCEENLCVEANTEIVALQAVTEGFGMAGQLIAGIGVEVYDNNTGAGTGEVGTSNADGHITFELKKGKLYGFRSKGDNYKDTFVWNVKAQDEETATLWIVPNTVYQMALGLAGLTQESSKGVVIGAVNWISDAGVEEAIGCATVTSDPETPDIRYMSQGNGLPTTLGNQACTAPDGSEGKGRFIVANVPVGPVSLTAWDSEGGQIGETQVWSVAGLVTVNDIDAVMGVYESNPTPEICQCQP